MPTIQTSDHPTARQFSPANSGARPGPPSESASDRKRGPSDCRLFYDFTGGIDGSYPSGNVIFDSNGNMHGTTTEGGAYGYGVVWEITP